MNKLSIILIAIFASVSFTSCDDEVDAPNVLEIYNGYYISGDATPFSGLETGGGMVAGNVVGQATKFLDLSNGNIVITHENNSTAEQPNTTSFGLNSADELVIDGDVINFAETAGKYFFRIDTTAKSISHVAIESWGAIGSATPGGWGEDTNMTLESSDNGEYIYTVTVDLIGGEWLKFRANDQWAPQFGVVDGSLSLRLFDSESDPGSIQVPESGNYTIKLILGTKFDYELKKN
ncbi:SusF/SusE family outer membrane protein [Marinifilum sp. N1E240]|uniref:SusF/SusE family outer membrane protein n=1 Tax=Marinifilum sp. N1E240 TaxID=2608082 RepID=UPI00128CCBDD|nr:SusF/SusE family outer membrane protein [Marinifilum sp. N1E240]MPQ46161.1 SusF/SusE family outer membrane protein [Marinifilum sp. N1E240]